jgi:hypothetical protein
LTRDGGDSVFCLDKINDGRGKLGRVQADSYVFKRSCIVGAVVRRRFVYELVDSDDEQSENEKNPELPLDDTSDNGVIAVGLSDNVLKAQDDDGTLSIISISDG